VSSIFSYFAVVAHADNIKVSITIESRLIVFPLAMRHYLQHSTNTTLQEARGSGCKAS
jgi:hypothetical protein